MMSFASDGHHAPARTMSPFARRRDGQSVYRAPRSASRLPVASHGLSRGLDGVWRSDTFDPSGAPSYTRGDLERLHRKLRGGR